MPAPSRPNFVRRLLSFSRQLSSRPSRRGRMCKKTVTTKDGRLVSVGGHGVDVAEAARACAAPVIGQNSTRAGAAEFWAMSGAATKLPPKKLLQRHAGPSQRAAGQLLLWARTVLGPISRFSHPISLVSPYQLSSSVLHPETPLLLRNPTQPRLFVLYTRTRHLQLSRNVITSTDSTDPVTTRSGWDVRPFGECLVSVSARI